MNTEIWTFKHEPKTIGELIASPDKKKKLEKIIKTLPNSLICGKPGTGKGTFMNILKSSRDDLSFLKINASMETGIDNIRHRVKKFATAFSPHKTKIAYLNEADRISEPGQDALRDLIESTEKITRFFFVANNEGKITDAIKSRCGGVLNLDDPPEDEILKHCEMILKKENCSYNKNKVNKIIKELYPDIRKIIHALQAESKQKGEEKKVKKNIDTKVKNVSDTKDTKSEGKAIIQANNGKKQRVHTKDEIDETLVTAAVKKINGIAQESIYNGMIEIGKYVLKTFFNNNMDAVKSKNPHKINSFKALKKHSDLQLHPNTLLQAVKVANQEKYFSDKKVNIKGLSYTHKAILTPLENNNQKVELIKDCLDNKMTTKILRNKVSEILKSTIEPSKSLIITTNKISRQLDVLDTVYNNSQFDLNLLNKKSKAGAKEGIEKLQNKIKVTQNNLTKLLKKCTETLTKF